jgi:hypothetical protein
MLSREVPLLMPLSCTRHACLAPGACEMPHFLHLQAQYYQQEEEYQAPQQQQVTISRAGLCRAVLLMAVPLERT